MAKREREVRWQPFGLANRALVIVDSPAWVMVRRADNPSAAPFVISRKEWDGLPLTPGGKQ